jgi:hypothetical protein
MWKKYFDADVINALLEDIKYWLISIIKVDFY